MSNGMNGGDAFEQTMKILYQGTETSIKLLGKGAEQLMLWIAAILAKNENKPSIGKTNLIKMLQEGQPLKVVSIKQNDLSKFASLAKNYGIPFTPIKDQNRNDGMYDVLVREGDADRINIIFESLARDSLAQGQEKNDHGTLPTKYWSEPNANSNESANSKNRQRMLSNGQREQHMGLSAEPPRILIEHSPPLSLPASDNPVIQMPPHDVLALPPDEGEKFYMPAHETMALPPSEAERARTSLNPKDKLPAGEAERLALPADNNVVQVYIPDPQTGDLCLFTPQMVNDFQKRNPLLLDNSEFEVKDKPSVKKQLNEAKAELTKRKTQTSAPKKQKQKNKKAKGR